MIEGEYGNRLFVNTNDDLSAATNIKLKLKGEGKTLALTSSDGLVVGSVDLVVSEEETFLANQYVIYTTKPGDICSGGKWRAYVEYDNGTERKVGETAFFYVEDKCF